MHGYTHNWHSYMVGDIPTILESWQQLAVWDMFIVV